MSDLSVLGKRSGRDFEPEEQNDAKVDSFFNIMLFSSADYLCLFVFVDFP
jgi:hypothetical protein